MLGILRGALAGAAGSTALNTTTYLDMAIRGRGTSDAPQQLVQRVAERAGIDVPGRGDERAHRVQGLGPLAGIAVGVGIGAVVGAAHRALARRGRALPAAVEVGLLAAAAMALSDVPLARLGVSDPSEWGGADWASDVVPHLVYGLVTYAGLRAVQP